ncbi:MAG TPA: rhomboid family intramembrane serine protease, partial [Myxococcales bacterium]|nr:rhomboid family intramembrane serine protease [Myxococcales bacterium]
MLLFPLRVEEAEVNRLPWASISIAVLCAAMFFVTWVAPRNPTGLSVESMEKVLKYWVDHPYLRLPDRLTRMFPPHLHEGYLVVRAKATGAAASLPEPEQIAGEQAELDGLTAEVFRRMDASLLRRLAFVPERGLGQKGLLTHMFLHGGWEHLLWNMVFFYVAALLLEDRWGRGFFVGFYLLGGLVAVLAQYLMETGSQTMVVGASGAVAA